MKQLPSRLRRLDDALAALPVDEPMLLDELDGFLTGMLVGMESIGSEEWMQSIWGSDENGIPPFDDPIDVQWFADAIMAHRDGIARDLNRGKPQPLFDIDERNGDVVWEPWIDGFAEAMALRPDDWTMMGQGDDRDAADAVSRLSMLIAVARDESALDSMEINALDENAPAQIVDIVRRLHAARLGRDGAAPATPTAAAVVRIGRNDPCACGSGRKSKRCCGRG